MKKRYSKNWIPLWPDKWLWGSTRIELEPDERGVWIDFLALGSKDDGWIRANKSIPYPSEQLAGMLRISIELLERTIEKCIKVGKLKKHPNGTFYIINWKTYQFSDRHKQRVSPEINPERDAKFDELWKMWPPEGRFKKKHCIEKFNALYKAGKYDEFWQTTLGYGEMLKAQRVHNNFEQRVMFLSTWLNNWEQDKEQYKGFKCRPKL